MRSLSKRTTFVLRGVRWFGLVCSSIALFCWPVRANTYTAASDSLAAVQTAVNLTSNGDTVQIPCSGTQSVTWTSGLSVSTSITITALGATPNVGPSTFGAGTNCLTIYDNYSGGPIFLFRPTYASSNNVTTLQDMNIDPVTATTALTSPIYLIGTATSSGFPEARLDNIVFGNSIKWNESGNSSNAAWLIRQDDVIGVADHNTLPSGSSVEFLTGNFSAYLGVGQYGDNSWAQPDSLGGADNWFDENNSLFITEEINDCEISDSIPDNGGCRIVNRFNQVNCSNCFQLAAVHGLDSSGRPRSGRHTEAYKNTAVCSYGACQDISSYRGGTGMTWGNSLTVSGAGFWNGMFDITVYRTVWTNPNFGACGGLNSLDPWDTVDDTVYYSGTMTTTGSGVLTMTDPTRTGGSAWTTNQFIPNGAPYSVYDTTQGVLVSEINSNTSDTITINPSTPWGQWTGFNNGDSYEIIRATICADQGGRGQGNYISGLSPITPANALNEALDPVYEWDDSNTFTSGQFIRNTARVIPGRDYYTDNWKGGGVLGGPTAQTSSTVPFNGTTTCHDGGSYTCGVGFGTTANEPTTCTQGVGYFATDQGNWNQSGSGGQGELFVCGASNNWVLHYEPYTYPHPLITGGTSGTGVTRPNPPTDPAATVQQ